MVYERKKLISNLWIDLKLKELSYHVYGPNQGIVLNVGEGGNGLRFLDL